MAKNKLHASAVIHILDDFLFLGPSEAKCTIDLKNFLNLCHQIGVPIANEKTMGPATALKFAGITLDTVSMEARLPDDKLDKCREHRVEFLLLA